MKKVLLTLVVLGMVCFIAIVLRMEMTAFTLDFRNLPLALGNFSLRSYFDLKRPTPKMLIYVCKGNQGCAGWSDRQRSMVAVFLLALVTNGTFGILLNSPCDVSNFYMPNKYNWIVDERALERRSQRLIYPADNLSTVDFDRQYREDVLFARVNSECFPKITSNPRFQPLLPAWAKQPYGRYFHDGWEILMKPTPKLQRRLEQFLESVNFYNSTKPLVGLHLRMGRNPSNPYDGKVFNQISQLGPVWQRVALYVKNGSQLFVASDSQEVRNVSRQKFGKSHHDTAGVILHVGKQRHDVRACQGFEDAILDQLILSYCDILFRSKGGFSMRASFMNRKVSRVYVIRKGKVSP